MDVSARELINSIMRTAIYGASNLNFRSPLFNSTRPRNDRIPLSFAQDGLRFSPTSPRFLLRFFCRAFIGAVLFVALNPQTGVCGEAERGSITESGPGLKTVNVTTRREADTTHFVVENRELSEITMTFEVRLVNLKGGVAFPYTVTFPSGQVTEAFTLAPAEPGKEWAFSYTNFYKLGSNCARHDDSQVYELPYAPGGKFKVTQGYNGKFSHTGSNQYATDWQMPEGTLVLAARAGTIVRVKDDSDKGGASMDYDRFNNYVLIRHDDGTLAHYCHLQKGGCIVHAGERVAAGDPIAHSGNTGFSSGPHLHFCVFKTKDGRQRVSIPVKFRTSSAKATTLLSGHSYRAADVGSLTLRSPANAPAPLGGTAP
jgi:murein DD-endopeptidase MepM/ murein hydrolase activator NlpD